MLKNPLKEGARRHPNQMSDSPQLAALDTTKQRFNSDPNRDFWASHSKPHAELSHLNNSDIWSLPIEQMFTGESWHVNPLLLTQNHSRLVKSPLQQKSLHNASLLMTLYTQSHASFHLHHEHNPMILKLFFFFFTFTNSISIKKEGP